MKRRRGSAVLAAAVAAAWLSTVVAQEVALDGSACYDAALPDTTNTLSVSAAAGGENAGNRTLWGEGGGCSCPLDDHLKGILAFQGKTLVCDYRCYEGEGYDPFGGQECGFFARAHPPECRACSVSGCDGAIGYCVPCQHYCPYVEQKGCVPGACALEDTDREFLASIGVRVTCDESCVIDSTQPGCNFWDLGVQCRGCQLDPCDDPEQEGCYQCPEEERLCSTEYEQCGGLNWDGPTCCADGFYCNTIDENFSQCLGSGLVCSADEEQCGGATWDGPVCCEQGLICNYWNEHFSQCVQPKNACSVQGGQCGGIGYSGPVCCQGSQVCNYWDENYSSCVPAGDCGAQGGQCGGADWTGITCCQSGLECSYVTDELSECTIPSDTCRSAYDQCGGAFFTGEECCREGLSCFYWDQYYSQCLPPPAGPYPSAEPTSPPTSEPPSSGCSAIDEQCGGVQWEGATCCEEGLECFYWNEWYSQCLESAATPGPTPSPTTNCRGEYDQCGGNFYDGPGCCQEGLLCYYYNEWYSQCLASTPGPTQAPTPEPTQAPTPEPTDLPTPSPSLVPTAPPTPTLQPTPTPAPTTTPGTPQPTGFKTPAPTPTQCVSYLGNCFESEGFGCCEGLACSMNVCINAGPTPPPSPVPTVPPTDGLCVPVGESCERNACCFLLDCVPQGGQQVCLASSTKAYMKVNYEIEGFGSNVCGDALNPSKEGTIANTLCADSCLVERASVLGCSLSGTTPAQGQRRHLQEVTPTQCSADPTASCDVLVEVELAYYPSAAAEGSSAADSAATGVDSFVIISNFDKFSETVGVAPQLVTASNIALTAGDIEVDNTSSQQTVQGRQDGGGTVVDDLFWVIILVAVLLLMLWFVFAYFYYRQHKQHSRLIDEMQHSIGERDGVEMEVEEYVSKLMVDAARDEKEGEDGTVGEEMGGAKVFDEYGLPYHNERGEPLPIGRSPGSQEGSEVWSGGSGGPGSPAASPNRIFPEMVIPHSNVEVLL